MEKVYSTKEAAELLGVTYSYVCQYCREGAIKANKVKRKNRLYWQIPASSINEFKNSNDFSNLEKVKEKPVEIVKDKSIITDISLTDFVTVFAKEISKQVNYVLEGWADYILTEVKNMIIIKDGIKEGFLDSKLEQLIQAMQKTALTTEKTEAKKELTQEEKRSIFLKEIAFPYINSIIGKPITTKDFNTTLNKLIASKTGTYTSSSIDEKELYDICYGNYFCLQYELNSVDYIEFQTAVQVTKDRMAEVYSEPKMRINYDFTKRIYKLQEDK